MDGCYLIDFDMTFSSVEALPLLADIATKHRPKRQEILREVSEVTEAGMRGDIPFDESLKRRLELIAPTRNDIEALGELLREKVTASIARNKRFFRRHRKKVYIISGGFKEFILPVTDDYGVPRDQVFANTLVFDEEGYVKGYDSDNLLSKPGGKKKFADSLGFGNITVIGDGYEDMRMKESANVSSFIAFTEHASRPEITDGADTVAASFDEVMTYLGLTPRKPGRVLLLENIHEDAAERFRREGFEVEHLAGALSEDELIEKAKGVSIIGIRSKTKITRRFIENAPDLKVIGAFCIGTNQIDLPACTEAGVAVFNAPYANTRSVVELVIGHIIMLMRGIPEKNAGMHKQQWNKSAAGATEIRGKRLGIVGYGNIGSQLSILAEAMGMEVQYYDIVDKLALGKTHQCDTLDELLATSDVVSLHVDGRPENKGFIGEKELSKMKRGSFLINMSRGTVVDIGALVKHLRSRHIAGAAIDVFPREPKNNTQPFESELVEFENVVLTPHIGGSTSEAQHNIASFVPEKITTFMQTGTTMLSVNFPNVRLPEKNGSVRVAHIHLNRPGVLARINEVCARREINIEGQHLGTNASIGYVITDINGELDTETLGELESVDGTIAVRVI